jgi:hypothetical protein
VALAKLAEIRRFGAPGGAAARQFSGALTVDTATAPLHEVVMGGVLSTSKVRITGLIGVAVH